MKKFKYDKKTNELFRAILSLENKKEAEMYFRDLCTPEEITDMADRWGIAQALDKGTSYRKVAEKFSSSTTTVARVALWLKNGTDGYRLAINRKNKSHHKSP